MLYTVSLTTPCRPTCLSMRFMNILDGIANSRTLRLYVSPTSLPERLLWIYRLKNERQLAPSTCWLASPFRPPPLCVNRPHRLDLPPLRVLAVCSPKDLALTSMWPESASTDTYWFGVLRKQKSQLIGLLIRMLPESASTDTYWFGVLWKQKSVIIVCFSQMKGYKLQFR